MKIYNRSAFIGGIICAGAFPLFALGIIEADWWQWMISIAITARLLYIGLSEPGSKQAQKVSEHYKETAVALYGKHYVYKTYLPVVLMAVFFPIALILRFGFDFYLPVWLYVVFVFVLTLSVAYSIGIERSIREHIEASISDDT